MFAQYKTFKQEMVGGNVTVVMSIITVEIPVLIRLPNLSNVDPGQLCVPPKERRNKYTQ